MIPTTRAGKRRLRCKKLSLKSSKFQRLELFTRAVPDSGRECGSEKILAEAKKVVLRELERLKVLVDAEETSGFERAWFEASGETNLWFNFAGMRDNVINARFGLKHMNDTDFGYNNAVQVILNKHKAMNQVETQKTLLHEAFHHNVKAGDDGARPLSTNVDHLALALLGDPNECASFKLGWLSCPFSKCDNPDCRKYDWEIVWI